jgi:GTPase SAR1 family protein
MAEWNERFYIKPRRKLPFNHDPSKDINILLIGETGVGKTTFINAFVNYIIYDTLDAALRGQMQVLIPSVFSVADSETHNSTTITVGTRDKNELCEENGQSQTQGCKSYLFSIGDRYLRFIDTPGVGDCRGVEQDNDNFEHLLAFISRYEHLNGICILLKPNDHRLNISFRYIIKESLKHLHVNAKDNIMFVFTNARANFYTPGATAIQLRILLNQIEENGHERVPFSKDNTFLFDNESFRFLAVCKAGHHFLDAEKPHFVEGWNRSVAELTRMMARIMQCDLHAVRDMESLNEAHQLIRKLPRPIGEITTLIQENIQLAEDHKRKVLANAKDIIPNRIPEKIAEVVTLRYPRTICKSRKCSKVIEIDGEIKLDYKRKCHEHCYLKGVEQEVINNPILKHCSAMDKTTGKYGLYSAREWSKFPKKN